MVWADVVCIIIEAYEGFCDIEKITLTELVHHSITRAGRLLRLLRLSMLNFPFMLRVKMPVAERVQVTSLLQVWRTRVQATQNLMVALLR